MRIIPPKLYNTEIESFIDEMVSYHDAKDFYSLDDNQQDRFVALCIRALGCDVDVVLGEDGNKFLINYLLSNDRDEEIEVMNSLKDSAREQFGHYFNEILNGEVLWWLRTMLHQKNVCHS